MPESQRDLFRLLGYRNNNLDEVKDQLYRFARQLWGIHSSFFIAFFEIGRLIHENPTNASAMTLRLSKRIGTWMTFCWHQTHSMISKEFLANQHHCLKVEVSNCTNGS